jgi:hypothetical protein
MVSIKNKPFQSPKHWTINLLKLNHRTNVLKILTSLNLGWQLQVLATQ